MAGGQHLFGRVGVVHGGHRLCCAVLRYCRVDKCIASSTGAIIAAWCICASLTADPKLLTFVQILTGAVVFGEAEARLAKAGRSAWLVKAALEVIASEYMA